jgi:hypothetical protein
VQIGGNVFSLLLKNVALPARPAQVSSTGLHSPKQNNYPAFRNKHSPEKPLALASVFSGI